MPTPEHSFTHPTCTEALPDPVPMALLQLNVYTYIRGVSNGPVDWEPEAAFEPVQSPDAVHMQPAPQFCVDHESVDEPPTGTAEGNALRETVGGGGGGVGLGDETLKTCVAQLFVSLDSTTVFPASAHTSNRCVPVTAVHALLQLSVSVTPAANALVVWFGGVTSHVPLSPTSIRNRVDEEAGASAPPWLRTCAV